RHQRRGRSPRARCVLARRRRRAPAMIRSGVRRAGTTLALWLALTQTGAAALTPALEQALHEAKYVYIQSQRKSGEMGKPAEIWFLYDDGAVVVGTRPTSFRVRRIRAKRTRAHIAVGKPDGPAFDAVGEVVKDPALEKKLLEGYAKKYPEGWKTYEAQFRSGFANGERVLVRYRPR